MCKFVGGLPVLSNFDQLTGVANFTGFTVVPISVMLVHWYYGLLY
jgi:hypothetical protein